MASKEKNKKIVSNTAYTIGGALLMNGVLQVLVYPLLNRFMGSDQLGELLYLMGLVAILCPSGRAGFKHQPPCCEKRLPGKERRL